MSNEHLATHLTGCAGELDRKLEKRMSNWGKHAEEYLRHKRAEAHYREHPDEYNLLANEHRDAASREKFFMDGGFRAYDEQRFAAKQERPVCQRNSLTVLLEQRAKTQELWAKHREKERLERQKTQSLTEALHEAIDEMPHNMTWQRGRVADQCRRNYLWRALSQHPAEFADADIDTALNGVRWG